MSKQLQLIAHLIQ